MKIPLRNTNNFRDIMNLWLEYAKEFLGESKYLKNNKVLLNYNEYKSLFSEYKKLFTQEIYEYSEKIFGHIEGTENIIN